MISIEHDSKPDKIFNKWVEKNPKIVRDKWHGMHESWSIFETENPDNRFQ